MFIFHEKRFKGHFIHDGLSGSIAAANESGWMQENDFQTFLEFSRLDHLKEIKF